MAAVAAAAPANFEYYDTQKGNFVGHALLNKFMSIEFRAPVGDKKRLGSKITPPTANTPEGFYQAKVSGTTVASVNPRNITGQAENDTYADKDIAPLVNRDYYGNIEHTIEIEKRKAAIRISGIDAAVKTHSGTPVKATREIAEKLALNVSINDESRKPITLTLLSNRRN